MIQLSHPYMTTGEKKNIALTIWTCVCYDQCILLEKMLAFALLHFVLQGQTWLLFQVFLDFLLVHSSPHWWKGYCFLELVLEGLEGHHAKSLQVVSDSARPHRWQPIRLRHPWDSPGKNTGVGCHFLSNACKWKVKVKLLSRARSSATPWTAVPGSSVHGIFQARVLE